MKETLRAAFVIARRDFVSIIFSKTFVFFLIGPLFPLFVGAMAGALGMQAQRDLGLPKLGVALAEPDLARLLAAERAIGDRLGRSAPEIVVLEKLAPGATFDARAALNRPASQQEASEQEASEQDRATGVAAVLTGSLSAPVLTGPSERVERWRGPVSLLAAEALASQSRTFPEVRAQIVTTSAATQRQGQMTTAQAAQAALFLLTVMLAGMVLSNLVEEKSNKIIEVLAAAIPMDALFLGKLFAMLGISLVAIAVWGGVWGGIILTQGQALFSLPAPALGWPLFLVLGFCYFTMAYLLLGSMFLMIGGMANTVREVQTLSMPVTMAQLMIFFFASYAVTKTGTPVEWAAVAVPFSSPYAMIARAAQQAEIWPHVLAVIWQALWVFLIIRGGAHLFRRTVMKSGASRGHSQRGLAARLKNGIRTAGRFATGSGKKALPPGQ